jgi:hypothetical protein
LSFHASYIYFLEFICTTDKQLGKKKQGESEHWGLMADDPKAVVLCSME